MKIQTSILWLLLVNAVVFAQPVYTEQVKLTTDREIYFTGEKICFKADVETESELLSTILYIELYDQQHNSVVKEKYRIAEHQATGFIDIPVSASTGNYLLRAYTHYSRNFHPQTQTTLLVSIINPSLPVSEIEMPDYNEVFVAAEGNSLIAGIPARLAVRLVPYEGIDEDEIQIITDGISPVTSCKPYDNGIVLLEFVPEEGKNYELVVNKHGGDKITKHLDVAVQGISIKPDFDGTTLRISWPGQLTQSSSGYRLRVLSHGGVSMLDAPLEGRGPIEVPFGKYNERMAYCILQKESEIIQVHGVFTGHTIAREIAVQIDSLFNSRDEAVASIDVPRDYKGSLLVSVVYNGSGNKKINYIPWYAAYNSAFFSSALNSITRIDADIQKQIDALMILYSDFLKSTGIINRETKSELQFIPELRDAQISGRLVDKASGQPAANTRIFCSVVDSSNQVHLYHTDSDGRFHFTLNHLVPEEHMIFVCPVAKDSVELLIDSDFDTRYPESAAFVPFLPGSYNKGDLNRMYRNSQLSKLFPENSIQIKERRMYYPVSQTDAIHVINLSDFIEMPVMEEIFSEIVPFTSVRKRDDGYYLQLYDERTRASLDDPLIILDGIPFFDVNQIMTIAPDMVRKIEMTNRQVYLGDHTLNGVVRIETDTKNFAGLKPPASSRFINFKGIKEPSFLVFPRHNNSGSTPFPDFRTVLYWNAFATADHKVSFYTSDAKGKYTITVSGADRENSYFGEATFKVR